MDRDLMERLERLQARFDSIRESLAKVHGKDKAHCAAVIAHMIALDNMVRDGAAVVAENPSTRDAFVQDMHEILMSIGQDVCEHLNVDTQEAIHLMHHFQQVLTDLFNQRG